jgi:myo-inositol-1(or 4)-monophosphatase
MKHRLTVMKRAAREAGEFVLGAQHLREQSNKSNAKDFVTLADVGAQEIIRKTLAAAFPEAVILSEEDPAAERTALHQPDFTGFVIDPIDGTYNFKRDMRKSAVSIGYIEKGESIAGVVYDPYQNELYEAEKGQGAFRNGQTIHVSGQAVLDAASIATSNSYDDAEAARNLRRQLGIYEQSGIMPWTDCQGSAVLTMLYVADGRFDAYHHNSLKPWDNAAAFVIAREAGGLIQSLRGEAVNFTTADVLIANPTLTEILQQIFDQLDPELLA